jgi:hypothetical protein
LKKSLISPAQPWRAVVGWVRRLAILNSLHPDRERAPQAFDVCELFL